MEMIKMEEVVMMSKGWPSTMAEIGMVVVMAHGRGIGSDEAMMGGEFDIDREEGGG